MLVGTVSADVSLNPFANKKIFETTITEDMSDFVKETFNEQYGVIRLSETLLWFESDKIAEYSLTDNTDYCLTKCNAQGRVMFYQNGTLFEEMNFYDFNDLDIKKELEYNIFYKGEYDNDWKEYDNEILIGNYEWRIEAIKEIEDNIEWIGTTFGKDLTEWASWQFGNDVESIAIAPLGRNTFALAWCDETEDDIHLQMYNTKGISTTSIINVDNAIGTCNPKGNSVSVSALNSTTLVVGYYDDAEDDMTFSIYSSDGDLITGPIDVDTNVDSNGGSVSVLALTNNIFVIGWFDYNVDHEKFSTYYSNGTQIAGEIIVDSQAGSGFATSLTALTNKSFVIGWFDDAFDDVTFSTYYSNGTKIAGPIDADASAGQNSGAVSVSALTNESFVIGWFNLTDTTFSTYYSNGTLITGPFNVFSHGGVTEVSVSALTNNTFVISWFDDDADDHTFSIYYSNGTLITGPIDSETEVTSGRKWQAVSPSNIVTNISLCSGKFIHTFAIDAANANWITYESNGSEWDGYCDADIIPPYFTDGTPQNQTLDNRTALSYDIGASDEREFGGFIVNDTINFKIDFTTGLLENNTALSTGLYNINITINDTSNNKNSTVMWVNVTAWIPDIIPPYFTGGTPTNQTISRGVTLSYDIDADDNIALSGFTVNDTINFKIDFTTGLLETNGFLTTGLYNLNITINDTSNNKNSTIMWVNITDWIPPDRIEIHNWNLNSSIVSGLPDIGDYAAPTVFNMSGTYYLITGKMYGAFAGYKWNGVEWESNSTIISGLGDIGMTSTPNVFKMGDTYHLISGEDAGGFYGFTWDGTDWQSNTTLISGLINATYSKSTAPTVFYVDDDLYLISGDDDGKFYGFVWNGTGWSNDTLIAKGLFDVGYFSTPVFFKINQSEYLLTSGCFDFYRMYELKGNSWLRISDLDELSGFQYSRHTIFNLGLNYYMIRGSFTGSFYGYKLDYSINLNHPANTFIYEDQTVYTYPIIYKLGVTGTFDEFGGVVIENGIGYVVGKSTEHIYSFNTITGDIIWSTDLFAPSDGTPLLDDDAVYINTYSPSGADPTNGVYKLDKTTGEILAQNHTCSMVIGINNYYGIVQSLAMSDDLVFGGCMDGNITAYNKNDLTVNWTSDIGYSIVNTPLYYDGKVFTGGHVQKVYLLNATDGTHIWNDTGGTAKSNMWDNKPAYYNNVVYYSGGPDYGVVTARNWTNGSIIWENDPGGFGEVAIHNGAMWTPQGAYTGDESNMSKINMSDGSTICSYKVGNTIYQGPSISGGMVFFGSLDNYMYALNESDCSVLWRYDVGETIFSPPAIAQGKLYITTDNYYMYAFDLGVGTEDWPYLGHNTNGTSYSPGGLTENKAVSINCGSKIGDDIICNVTNDASHIIDLTLQYSENVNWYNESELLSSTSTSLTILGFNIGDSQLITLNDDTTPPYFSTPPANEAITYGDYWDGVTFNGTDERIFDSYSVNDSRFIINSTGYLNMTNYNQAGIYNLNITINDTFNNKNSTIYTLTINQAIPQGTLSNTDTWTEPYLESITIGLSETNTGDDDLTYIVYRDGVGVGTGETITLGVGTYNYVLNTTGGANYTANASMDAETLTIEKIDPSTNMVLSVTSPIEYQETSDFAESETNTGDDGCIYSLNETNRILAVGTWTFNYSTTGCANYTSGSIVESLVVNQNSSLVLGISGTTPITYGTVTDVAGSGCPDELSCSLNISNQIYSAGVTNFNYSTSGNANYTSTSITKAITINKAATTTLSLTGTTPITYPTVTDFVGSGCPAYLVCSLNLSNQIFGAGTISANYSTPGNANYSSDSDTFTITINKGVGVIYAYVNEVRSNYAAYNDTLTGKENIWLNGTIQTGGGNIRLYLDDVFINSGTSPIGNLSDLPIGSYYFKANYTGNVNYTSDSESWLITISEPAPPAPPEAKPSDSFDDTTTNIMEAVVWILAMCIFAAAVSGFYFLYGIDGNIFKYFLIVLFMIILYTMLIRYIMTVIF